jgi:hypothetical protein
MQLALEKVPMNCFVGYFTVKLDPGCKLLPSASTTVRGMAEPYAASANLMAMTIPNFGFFGVITATTVL